MKIQKTAIFLNKTYPDLKLYRCTQLVVLTQLIKKINVDEVNQVMMLTFLYLMLIYLQRHRKICCRQKPSKRSSLEEWFTRLNTYLGEFAWIYLFNINGAFLLL